MGDECSGRIEADADDDDLQSWQEVPGNESSPFIHKFETERNKYVYDVNTRRIVRVSSLVWDILEDFGNVDEKQVIARYSGSHSEGDITAALEEIAVAREQKGLFLSNWPKKILPFDKEKIRTQLDDHREQLILNVTEDCNFRCSYCVYGGQYEDFRPHSIRAMTWEVARPAIDDFLNHSKLAEDRTISFYGGEPLLNLPLVRRCVAYIRQNHADLDVQFSLTTNGLLLRDQPAKFLAEEGFRILISLDGPAEIHDRNRRTKEGNPTWAQVMSNIREFIEAYPEYKTNGLIRFNAVATRATDLCDADRFWRTSEVFTDCMGLLVSPQRSPGKPGAASPDDRLEASSKALREEFIEGLKSGRFGKTRKHRSNWVQAAAFERPFVTFHKRGFLSPHLPEETVFLNHCVIGARRTFVSTEGDYFACERVPECQGQIIGNVREGVDLEKVTALLGRWSQANRDQCSRCWCFPICDIGCLATLGDDGTISDEAKEKACAMQRRRMHDLLIEYCSILEENPSAFDYTAELEFL